MGGRITIVDVAKEAGVSIKTVSNVLNNQGRMRDSTRRNVEQAMLRLGYRPSTPARSIRKNRTGMIGLAMMNLSQPFPGYLSDLIIREADSHDLITVTAIYPKGQDLTAIISKAYRFPVDGWLLFAEAPLQTNMLQGLGPAVLMGDYSSHDCMDSVTMPNRTAIEEMTTALIKTGMRRIALIGCPEWMQPREDDLAKVMEYDEGTHALRTQGYLRALKENELPVDPRLLISGDEWTIDSGAFMMHRLLDRLPEPPDAVVCLNDALAIGAISELHQRGLRIPEDIQVTGFDNIAESGHSWPSLTTVDVSLPAYAQTAVTMLMERIEGNQCPPRRHMTGFSIVQRESALLSLAQSEFDS